MLSFLIILFLSPFILLFLFTVPQFIWSFFQKPKLDNLFNKLFEKSPQINILEKQINGEKFEEILINNFRNAKYKGSEWDNEIAWENKKYKLEELTSLDIFVDHYAALQSHIILIFNFLDENNFLRKLCVSYEIKKTNFEDFNAYKTIYKNFEAGYIVGSFEDLVGVRYLRYSNFQDHTFPLNIELKEKFTKVNIFKTNFSKEEVLKIFQSVIKDVNLYSKKAYFYNFIYRNCLNEVLKHFQITKRFNYSYLDLLFIKKLLEKNKIF